MPRNGLLHLVTGEDGERAVYAAADRYWDAEVRAQRLSAGDVDPALAEAIRRVRELDDAPLPDPAFAARLECELLRSADPGPAGRDRPRGEPWATAPKRAGASSGWVVPSRLAAVNVAAAALLVIAVAASLVTLWTGSLGERERLPSPLVLAPGITDEKLLLEARFDAVPDGVLSAAVSRWVLQPGAEIAVGGAAAGRAAAAAYLVETGALSLRPDLPLPVTRAGATAPAPAAEGAWTTLLPGDRLFAPAGATALWRNDGGHPVRVLEATLASRDLRPQPDGVLQYPVISDPSAAAPDRPIEMAVIAVTLHPEGALPTDLVPGLAMLKVESGRLVAVDVDGFGNPLPPAELGQATRFLGSFPPGRVFRSGNDQPVRLLLVTIADANPLQAGQ